MMKRPTLILFALISLSVSTREAAAQFGGSQGGSFAPKPPEISEPDANGGRMVTFRTWSSSDRPVRVNSPDLFPDKERGFSTEMIKKENIQDELTIGPVSPGIYHYRFSNLSAVDWNLLSVPGNTLLEMRDVPHGVIADISHYSPYQRDFAHFQVYSPPGYETNDTAYPVLYLLNERTEPSESWIEMGRVNLILDNLIASGKAQPMIVVVCENPGLVFTEENTLDDEVKRYVEKNYRVLPGQTNRAIAGSDAMDFALDAKNRYAYVGVFDLSRFFAHEDGIAQWEELHQAELADAEAKNGLRLVWLGYRKSYRGDSRVVTLGQVLTRSGFPVTLYQSENENSWGNYRDFLIDLAPRLFQPEKKK